MARAFNTGTCPVVVIPATSRMHVLFLPSWYSMADKPWRGTFFRDQARALQRHGLRVGVAFVERKSLSRFTPAALFDQHFQITSGDEEGLPTVRMKGWSTFAQTTAGSLVWSTLTRHLVQSYVEKHGAPDLIHGHGAMWGGYAAMMAARDIGRPFVVTEHASSILMLDVPHGARHRVASTYRNAARVMAVSAALKASVDCVAGKEVAEIVPNTVDSDHFNLPAAPRRRRPFTFLGVGDLVPSKRFDLLIRAFARLHKAHEDTRLVIAGEGRDRDRLRDLAAGHRAIEFTGALDRSAVRQCMWDANALVTPSAFETFGVVIIEALSTGLPVIATRCGGPEEILTPDLGILAGCGDEGALVDSMASAMEREFRPQTLRDEVVRRFGYEEVAARICNVYLSVAEKRRAA